MTAQFDPQLHTEWKSPAVPRHVLQMLVWDSFGRILLLHRSNTVSSARNIWSMPSGTHEIGETVGTCIRRELHEELHLNAKLITLLDQYENIAGDETPPHYHWIISVYGVQVDNVTLAVNKEPERHDQMLFVPLHELDEDFFDLHPFHLSLHSLISAKIGQWFHTAFVQSRTIPQY
jgi:ADP-ribose pyrophosphatase YjhB (NUDIX family)